jgi:hypothetical protein
MTLSNALPVQFWTDPDESFNNKEVCGVERVSWCHPWNCDDEINLQFQSVGAETYSLKVLDCDDVVLETIAIDQEAADPTDFLSGYPLSGFTSEAGAGPDWTTGATPSVSVSGFLTSSDALVESITGIPAGTYNCRLAHNFTGSASLSVTFRKAGIVLDTASFISANDPNGGYRSSTVTFEDTPDEIRITLQSNAIIGSVSISLSDIELVAAETINTLSFIPENYCNQSIKLQIINDIDSSDSATTDCLSVKTSHSCTKLVEYSNSRDFAGLVYQDVSPEQIFYLRIPAIFPDHNDDNPAEQKDLELSNGEIVRLYNKLELKRRLQIGFVPQYIHQKIQLILMHDNVTIDGKRWIRRDTYEKVEGHRTFPLRKANVNLHDKDFIKENQL